MKEACKIIVKGRVQGVGFRWFAREKAQQLGLTGYVRNLPDGNVEVFAEGEQEKLLTLINILKEGPSWSMVTGLDIENLEYKGIHRDFNIAM